MWWWSLWCQWFKVVVVEVVMMVAEVLRAFARVAALFPMSNIFLGMSKRVAQFPVASA